VAPHHPLSEPAATADSDRVRSTSVGAAAKLGKTVDEVLSQRHAGTPERHCGTAYEFGAFCAFMCSVHAAYLNGQNILLDGGACPGTF